MSEFLRWTVKIGGNGGEYTVDFPSELLMLLGISLGDTLIVKVIDGAIVLQPKQNALNLHHALTSSHGEEILGVCRPRIATWLQIPIDASDQAIHEIIASGFDSSILQKLCDEGIITKDERDLIVPWSSYKSRLANRQTLNVYESDRLYRSAYVIALAEAVFGEIGRAKNWLSKPKARFSGRTPMAMLSTSFGAQRVEEMLIQVSDGLYG